MNALSKNLTSLTLHSITSILLLPLLFLCSTIVLAQDVALLNQNEVDNFNPSTTAVNGNLRIGILSVPNDIVDLSNLSNVTTIEGNLIVRSNDILTSISGLNSISYVGGYLDITSNDSLPNINGLSNLTTVGGNLEINNNEVLSNISGLSNLTSLGGNIEIRRNENLNSLIGLESITEVNGSFEISRNSVLSDLNGLENLTAVLSDFEINFNASLENLDAISNLMQISGDLEVRANPMLTDCCGIQDLLTTPLAIIGSVGISSNPFGCNSLIEVINKECQITLVINANSPCEDLQNGSISVITGQYDTIPINYSWLRQEDGLMGMGQTFDGNFIIEDLDQGTYNIAVHSTEYDSAFRNDILLTSLAGSIFEILDVETINSTNGLNNGKINITVSGGTPPYIANYMGPTNGSFPNILNTTIELSNILPGNYSINVIDADGNGLSLEATLLDENIPLVNCTEPFDMIILNDVSSSVDNTEYRESKEFFVELLSHAEIGLEDYESKAGIIEWSKASEQEVKIPMTGDSTLLKTYLDAERSFASNTDIGSALFFGANYLENNHRPGIKKVIVLATDYAGISPNSALNTITNSLKAEGFYILTIAFDAAFYDFNTLDALSQMSSIATIAPGAPSYSDIDTELAQDIIDLYLCPIASGDSSTVFFTRDGALTIDGVNSIGSCTSPDYVSVEITIEAFNHLSIPVGTPISFYSNDPNLPGSSYLMTWLLPCGIPVGTSSSFVINLPINYPSNIYAVLNDDGSTSAPIQLPTTELEEEIYTNNIDFDKTCIVDTTMIQVTKEASISTAACDSIVYYNVNICNIGEYTADSINVIDQAPIGAILIDSIAHTNNCAEVVDGAFNIPSGCCVTINYSYDFSQTPFDFYNDQDVYLTTPDNILAFDFDGAYSSNENVLWDGNLDCPSTVIHFSKAVDSEETCDDNYIKYTFTINNEMNIPLQGLSFTDILPTPCQWYYQPYDAQGLSIANLNISNNIAEFTIAEVAANTVASFSMDVYLGIWQNSATLINTATLDNVPDPINGGVITLTSNTTNTEVIATPTLITIDTIRIGTLADTVQLNAIIDVDASTQWTTTGDGTIIQPDDLITSYILGNEDKQNDTIQLYIAIETDCHQLGQSVILIIENCLLNIETLTINECDDNNTEENEEDDTYLVEFNISASDIENNMYHLSINNVEIDNYSYNTNQSITLPADGNLYTLTLIDTEFDYCFLSTTVMQESCSVSCIDFEVSIESDTSTTIILGESINIFIVGNQDQDTYTWSNGSTEEFQIVTPTSNTTYTVTVTDMDACTSTASIEIEVIEGECETYIPNAFTPNNDNVNDLFYIRSKTIASMDLYIYNRWGEEVFHTTDKNNAWDGKYQGALLAPDAFAYFLKATCLNGEIIEQHGNISILR